MANEKKKLERAIKEACAGLSQIEAALLIAESMRDAGLGVIVSCDSATGSYSIIPIKQ